MKKTLLMLIFSGLSISVFADYYICYGSFRNQDNAFAESAALQAAGIESAVVEIKTDGAVLYRVIHPKGYADSDSAKWKIKYIVAELESPYPTQESFWVFESVDAPKTVVQTDAAVKEAAEMNDDLSVDAASGAELTDESAVEETNEVIAEETADGEISENSDEAVAADLESSNENVTEISNNEQSGNSSADSEESEEEIVQRVRRDAFAEKASDKFDVEGAEEAADGEVSEELTVEEGDETLAEEAADGEVSEELTVEESDETLAEEAADSEVSEELTVEESDETIAEEAADGEFSEELTVEEGDEALAEEAADGEVSEELTVEESDEAFAEEAADGEVSEELTVEEGEEAFAEEAADGEVSEELTVEEGDETFAEEAADGEVSEELTVEEGDETLAEEVADSEVSEELTVEEDDEALAEEGGKAAVSEIRFTLKNQSVYKTLFDSPAAVYAVIPEELTRGKVPVDFTVNLYRDRERVASKTGDFIPNLNKFSITETFPEAMFNDVTRTCEYTIELIFNGEVIAENSYLYFID